MPAAKGAPPSDPDKTSSEAPAEPVGASPVPGSEPTAQESAAGGAYEYTAPFTTVYHLPLTAHPAVAPVEATDDTEAVPALPATVFDWPDGPPDNRWTPTKKKPNQARDNDAPLTPTEV